MPAPAAHTPGSTHHPAPEAPDWLRDNAEAILDAAGIEIPFQQRTA